eukprot:gene563-17620_t
MPMLTAIRSNHGGSASSASSAHLGSQGPVERSSRRLTEKEVCLCDHRVREHPADILQKLALTDRRTTEDEHSASDTPAPAPATTTVNEDGFKDHRVSSPTHTGSSWYRLAAAAGKMFSLTAWSKQPPSSSSSPCPARSTPTANPGMIHTHTRTLLDQKLADGSITEAEYRSIFGTTSDALATVHGLEAGTYYGTAESASLSALCAVREATAKPSSGSGMLSTSKQGLYTPRVARMVEEQRNSGVMLHYSSWLVHNADLVDGTVQRELFSELASNMGLRCGDVVTPYGRMDAVVSYNDIARVLNDRRSVPPAVLVIEIPQRMSGNAAISFEDIKRVRALANQHGVHMHMDGSRLMEVLPFYGRAASEITSLFDSAVTSFTEGLCALSGAMLMGSAELVADAKLWQTRLGDSAVLPYGWTDSKSRWDAATASDCFRHRFERLTKLVAVLREDMLVMGSVRFTPEVICSCTTHVYMRGAAEDLEAIHEEVCADTGIRIWDHLRGPGFEARFASSDDDPWCYFEWTLGEHNMQIPDDVILDAWAEFGRRLHLWHKARQIKEKSPFLSCKISNANVHSIALNLQGSSINE